MKVLVDSKNFEVTKALRSFVMMQARKLSRVNQKVQLVRVHLESVQKKSNDPQANEVTYQVEVPGNDVLIKKKGVDMYETITSATGSAMRRLRKQFEKQRTKHRQ